MGEEVHQGNQFSPPIGDVVCFLRIWGHPVKEFTGKGSVSFCFAYISFHDLTLGNQHIAFFQLVKHIWQVGVLHVVPQGLEPRPHLAL